jgi:flavin-dependent dehydrogenase
MPIASEDRHAVVLGGSLAGLLAARVLSRHFSRVTLIERDRYPGSPVPRNGVPQGRHVHVLLLRGLRILESLLPGFTSEVEAAGGALLDSANDFDWLTPGGYAPRFESGLPFLAVSRPAIDWVVNRRVRSLRNVTILEASDVLGLTRSQGGIDGVRARARGGSETVTIPATLVVDATGRGSRTPEWLEVLGYETPRETMVNAHFGYASRIYRRGPESQAGFRAVYSQAMPPQVTRLGLAFPIEGGRWMVTLAGGGGDYPPVREDHWLDFARSLPNPDVYRVIRQSEPLGPIHGARSEGNRRVHYDRIGMPEGLVVTGDAACSFNPVYGQGMTTAAIGAQLLDQCLAGGGTHGFQKALATETDAAWMLSTSEDYRYPGVTRTHPPARFAPPESWMHAYLNRVIARSCADPGTRRTLLEVFHLVRPAAALFRPSILTGSLFGKRGGIACPEEILPFEATAFGGER